jgi:hypothetical protein
MNYLQMRNAPAFPVSFKWGKELGQYNGMTLRDYFAAKAMNQIIKQAYVLAKDCDEEDDFSFTATMFPFAKEAYQWADAMMKAREA